MPQRSRATKFSVLSVETQTASQCNAACPPDSGSITQLELSRSLNFKDENKLTLFGNTLILNGEAFPVEACSDQAKGKGERVRLSPGFPVRVFATEEKAGRYWYFRKIFL
jgi:hypothetical protein